MRKWRKNEEMEREWGNGERFTLYISSCSLYVPPLYPFPPSLSISKKKTEHTRYEIIIMGRIRCEKSPQVVRALRQDLCFCFLTFLLQQYRIFSPLGEVVVRWRHKTFSRQHQSWRDLHKESCKYRCPQIIFKAEWLQELSQLKCFFLIFYRFCSWYSHPMGMTGT